MAGAGAVQEFVLNLDWWSVADLAVEPAVVEPVDVFSRREGLLFS